MNTYAPATVAGKVTATNTNAIEAAVSAVGLSLVVPGSVGGTGVSVSALGQIAFAGATAVNVNGVFTGGPYRILINITSMAAAASWTMVMRSAGTDSTAANYDAEVLSGLNVTASAAQALAQTSWSVAASSALSMHNAVIDLFNPAIGFPTIGLANAFALSVPMTTAAAVQQRGISHRLSNAFDGFSINSTQAMNGEILVYQYNNG